MIEKYRKEFTKIEGCVNKGAIEITELIDKYQKENGIHGQLGEIGVWHAKFFVLLTLLARKGEVVFGCDLNPQLDKIYRTMGYYGKFKDLDYIITAQNSKDWDFGKLKHRLIHVDGDHTYKYAADDIEKSKENLVEKGVIVVDDFFHMFLPEVTEAVMFHLQFPNELKPIAMGANKLWLTQNDNATEYIKYLRKHAGGEQTMVKLCGHDVLHCQFNEWREI